MLKHLPNALTCGNLLCGSLGIVLVLNGLPLELAALFIYGAALFDFLDGAAARWLRVASPIGKELDSLADVISFGLLPGTIMYRLMLASQAPGNWALTSQLPGLPPHFALYPAAWLALLVPVFSALRLAKFNVDTRQSESFIGVPTPANALFISGLIFLFAYPPLNTWLQNYWVLATLTVVTSGWLVAELPLLALKFKRMDWAKYKFQYILLALAVILLGIFKFAAFPLIILLYIGLSVLAWRTK
ncbi:MAG: CDP-alcohol phosphatidyltransferase family protein [Bernardetiaceae bacterium]|jgi:CDP-diacylglycerol--serine O-phosphatidyltransferase|nr:CDP-alcohol phosphatidyltransferase family protein [Bernardetiaceae bacterium]